MTFSIIAKKKLGKDKRVTFFDSLIATTTGSKDGLSYFVTYLLWPRIYLSNSKASFIQTYFMYFLDIQ